MLQFFNLCVIVLLKTTINNRRITVFMTNQSNQKTKLSISLLSWAYNEESNIVDFIERAFSLLRDLTDDYELILINDASTDKTLEIASSYTKKYPQLIIINNPCNMDCGMNARIAINRASKDVSFWQMVDWSYDLSNIRQALDYLENYPIDVVQGVRITHKEATYLAPLKKKGFFKNVRVTKRSDNFFKAIVSLTNYTLVRLLFQLPLNDFQNVSFYKRELIQSISFETASSFTSPEFLLKTYRKRAVIKEIPIDFIAREKGKAKGTRLKSIISSIKNILYYWFKWIVFGKLKDNDKGIIIPYDLELSQVEITDLLINKTTGLISSTNTSFPKEAIH